MTVEDESSRGGGESVQFSVLGPVEVRDASGSLPLGSGKRLRDLLAIFLSRPNQRVSTDMLIESLWSEAPPPSASTALRVHLTRLRSRLEPNRPRSATSERLVTESEGYRLRVGNDELDSLRFEHLVEAARRAETPEIGVAAYTEAESLWRGPAFADVLAIDLARTEATRLDELRAAALEEMFELRLSLGDHAGVIASIQRAVEDNPLRENLAGQLMLALYRAGRQSEALRVYSDLRERLGEELGIEPHVALSRLETSILRQEPGLDLAARETATAPATARSGVVSTTPVGGGTVVVVSPAPPVTAGRVEIERHADEVTFLFPSASDAFAVAVDVLRADRRAEVGISVGSVVEAAALRRAAAPGSVLASETAMLMAHGHRSLRFDEPTRLGLDDSTTIGAAVGVLEREPAARMPIPGPLRVDEHSTFAGRAAEIEWLEAFRRSAEAGEQAVLVSGEPGIGKTRLAAEAATLAYGDDWTVLFGRCDEGVGAAFQPFVDMLDFFVSHTPDEFLAESLGPQAGELTRLTPSLRTRMGELEAPTHSDPDTERYQLFQAVVAWLRAATRQHPVMLVVDDLHWAARPTLLLLRHILGATDLEGVLVVATYRDTQPERGELLDEALADLSRIRSVERCHLAGLDVTAVTELLVSSAGMQPDRATADLAALLHEETNGNPFFLHELMRSLSGPEVLAELLRARGAAPSPGIRDVIAQRLSRLPSAVEEVLTMAAVIGRHFDLALLCTVCRLDEDEVLSLLDHALGARIVEEAGFDEFRFAHALVRSTLYRPLQEARRVRLHRTVGEGLEVLVDGRPEHRIAELAYHFLEAAEAGVGDKAVRYALAAARSALRNLGFEDAAILCRRGLAALETARAGDAPILPTDECDLVLQLGEAETRSGQRGARRTLLNAFELARRLDDRDRMAHAALAMNRGFFSRIGRTDDERVAALELAIGAQPEGDSAVLAELLASLASELVWREDSDRRFDLSDRALAMARRLGDRRTIANVLLRRNMTIAAPETLATRSGECDELLAIAEELRDPGLEFQAAFHRSGTALEAGNTVAANAMVELASKVARELNQPSLLFHASLMRTSRRILEGALDEAEQRAYATFDLGQRANQGGEALIFFTELLLEIRRWQGRLGEMLAEFRDLAGVDGVDFGYSLIRYLYDAGEQDDAIARYQEIMRRIRFPLPNDLLAGATLCNLAYVAARAGDTEAARIYEALSPLAGQFANTTVAKPITEHFLGMLATAGGDVSAAEGHFDVALEAHLAARAPLHAAETQLEWARLLVSIRGDPDRIVALTGAVRDTARSHGAVFLQQRLNELST